VIATDLIRAMASLPGARRLAAAPPITASVEIAGIEVATAGKQSEQVMRRTWRDRHRGATALLLVSDDQNGEGSLAVLGPGDGGGLVRRVDQSALEQLLRRISSMPRLEAVRELAGDLERLDQAGISGLRLRDLLTMHTLDTRLRGDPRRWAAAESVANAIPPGSDWRGVLLSFGYDVDRLAVRGYLLRAAGRPVAVVHPKAEPSEFAKLDPEGRPAEGALLNDCVAEGTPYGLLVSGARFRLFDFSGAAGTTSRYIDLDSGVLRAVDRPLLALLAPSYLADGGFAALVAEAAAFGAALRRRLDDRLRQAALPSLARGLETWARANNTDFTNEAQLAELEKAALTLVFRFLFLLFAESSRYLPMDNRAYAQSSLTALAQEAAESRKRLGERSTSLWDRAQVLVHAMRTGNPAWRVPAYNGALFAADGFDGAATLERMSMTDPAFADLLIAIGRDPDTGTGIDYSTLEIGHLGHIYEALLSLRLSPASRDLLYDSRQDRYRPARPGEEADVHAGSLLWQTNEGGRKSGGVYYTRTELVRQLVKESVLPAFEQRLDEVERIATRDAAEAARHLLRFAVIDPACGSAHFLVEVVNLVADRTVRFLAEHPLPSLAEAVGSLRAGALPGSAIDDSVLIRRLMLKHCVYGVDLSPMGAEVAKLSLWLASFVPGLSLAYLDGNLRVGNSLVGVVRTESIGAGSSGKYRQADWSSLLREAATAAARAADIEDRNPDEVLESQRAGADAAAASHDVECLFNLWTAESFGLVGTKKEVEGWATEILSGNRRSKLQDAADELAKANSFLHWPVAFPRVFAGETPGFDAVVGNPPWNEVTIEELAFYGLFVPGLRGLSERDRASAIDRLLSERPELQQRLQQARNVVAEQRRYLAAGEYAPMVGDPDLYKYFCQRYRLLLRNGGELGVVLPRSTFVTDGSTGFRGWLFDKTTPRRIDFLVNTGRWAFDSEPRYTVALLAATNRPAQPGHRVRVAGVASSLAEWIRQSESVGVEVPESAFGPGRMVPIIRDEAEGELLARLRLGDAFPFGSSGRWQCFPVAELHETNDAKLWRDARQGAPLWKGESFDQYAPSGLEARTCPMSEETLRKIRKPRPGGGSLLAEVASLEARRNAVLRELDRSRIAFRDVSRATDSRTVRACLIPKGVLLTNKAPYLAFVNGGVVEQSVCLAIMNSLPFDWQARRYVEVNLNFFILEGLHIPQFSDPDWEAVASAAARLSCVDERFGDFASASDMEPGELSAEEREGLRLEIDARVARAWGLSLEDLMVILRDFTPDAVSATYRDRLLARLGEL
jgi:hypothetical protein